MLCSGQAHIAVYPAPLSLCLFSTYSLILQSKAVASYKVCFEIPQPVVAFPGSDLKSTLQNRISCPEVPAISAFNALRALFANVLLGTDPILKPVPGLR